MRDGYPSPFLKNDYLICVGREFARDALGPAVLDDPVVANCVRMQYRETEDLRNFVVERERERGIDLVEFEIPVLDVVLLGEELNCDTHGKNTAARSGVAHNCNTVALRFRPSAFEVPEALVRLRIELELERCAVFLRRPDIADDDRTACPQLPRGVGEAHDSRSEERRVGKECRSR